MLINVSSLEAYVAQTRIQAEQSFKLSKLVAIVGFGLLSVGVILGIITVFAGYTAVYALNDVIAWLERRFGSTYRDYRLGVNRWLPGFPSRRDGRE